MDPRATARFPTRHPYAEGELIAMDWIHDDGPLDPRHVFLDASDVMSRYARGKTKGYQNLKDRSLVPPPVIRELRDLTRYRKRLVQDRTREG